MTARRLRGAPKAPPGLQVNVLPRERPMTWLGQTFISHTADLSGLIRLMQESVELRARSQELAAELTTHRIRFQAEHTIFLRRVSSIRDSLRHLRTKERTVPLLPGWRRVADSFRPDLTEVDTEATPDRETVQSRR